MRYPKRRAVRHRHAGRSLCVLGVAAPLALGTIVACGDGGIEPTPTVASITVSTSTSSLSALDQTSQFIATARDGSGNAMSGVSFTWASSDTDIATVDASGLVTAVGNGTATITASAAGVSGSATVTVAQAVAHAVFTVQPTNWSAGVAFAPDLEVELRDANDHVAVNSTDAVTISIGTNPNSATLLGTLTRNAAVGVATFPGISIDKPGVGCTLVATSAGASAESDAFNLTLPSVYVTHGNWVSVIETATNGIVATVPAPFPRNLAISPDGSTAYVLNFSGGTVSVIETATNGVTASITVGGAYPEGIAFTPDGSRAYVANHNAGSVSVIETGTNTVSQTIPGVGTFLTDVVITPDGAFAYVMVFHTDSVAVISTATNTVTSGMSLQVGDPADWGQHPYHAAMHPDGQFLYVANYGSGNVSVISTASNAVTNVIKVGTVPYDVAISPDGTFAYVTNITDNTVSVINTLDHTVTATFPTGPFTGPAGVAFGPAGDVAYIANTGTQTVSVIDPSSHAQVGSIAVGAGAEFLAVMPAPLP